MSQWFRQPQTRVLLLDLRGAAGDFHGFAAGERFAITIGQGHEAAARTKIDRLAGTDVDLLAAAAFSHNDRPGLAVEIDRARSHCRAARQGNRKRDDN